MAGQVGFTVPEWRSKAFHEFTNEELVEYYYKLRLAYAVEDRKSKEPVMADYYVMDLQAEIIKRMNGGK